MNKNRCSWCNDSPLYIAYHDQEWGVPIYDDHLLFEFLILEGMQAGLSWYTILQKREDFRKAFAQFDPKKIAKFSPTKIEKLMQNEKIIRNRLKIESAIKNAKAFLAIQKQQPFNEFIWQFVDGAPRKNNWKSLKQVPASTPESETMSKELKRQGFKFVGPTICYAFMQATGMVNDHVTSCFRYQEVG